MDNPARNYNLESKISKIFYLTAIAIISTLIQWYLLVNLEFFDFLINSWVIFGAYIIFIFIIIFVTIADFLDKSLPDVLEWIFAILLIEIVVIALSITVVYVDHIILYTSLVAVLICMTVVIALGAKINLDHLPIFVLIVFSSNLLLIILILALSIIAKFFSEIYPIAFLTVLAFAYPILIMNILYVSFLINNDRYEIKKLTDCLKPVLYIYGIFGALVWFSLTLSIVIFEML